MGRIFLAAGDWEAAIHYLGAEIRPNPQPGGAEERARVMLGAVSTMYSVSNKREALGCLARGFETAYPQAQLRLFDFDKERNALIPIDLRAPTAMPKRSLWRQLSAPQLPEVRALRSLQDYQLQPDSGQAMTLYVPLRSSPDDIQGLAVVDNFISRADFRRKHEQTVEMAGYLRHATRALRDRAEHESLNKREARRVQDLQNLHKWLLRLMNFKGSYDDILDHTLRSAVRALSAQAQMGSIYLYDRTTGLLTMRAHTGYPPEVRAAARFAPNEGLVGYVYKTERLWNAHDTAHDPHYTIIEQTPARWQARSSIGVPLRGRSGLIGVLCLDNLKRPHAFDEQSVQLLSLFASEVSPWLSNARLVNVLNDLHATAIELLELSSSDSSSLLETVAQRLLYHFNLNACVIGQRVSPWQLRRMVQVGLTGLPETIELDTLPAQVRQTVLTDGQPLVIERLREASADWATFLPPTAHATLTSLVALPLRDDEAQHSLLLLGCVGKFSPSAEELDLLQVFANQVALALENAGLYHQVHVDLKQTIDDLKLAKRRLEVQRDQEAQVLNARLAIGLLHQINNAVANIPELVDEIERSWLEPNRRPLIELRDNAIAVSNISDWLHHFVRLGNLTPVDVDLTVALQEALRQVEKYRPSHVAVEIGPVTTTPRVRADRALMEILFENLLRNAYEALPAERPGRVRVDLEVTPEECIVRVADNGEGIKPDKRESIWELGFTTKLPDRKTHDRGLGLYACKQIVNTHAGSIELAESRENEGSTFVVRLPIAGPPHPSQES